METTDNKSEAKAKVAAASATLKTWLRERIHAIKAWAHERNLKRRGQKMQNAAAGNGPRKPIPMYVRIPGVVVAGICLMLAFNILCPSADDSAAYDAAFRPATGSFTSRIGNWWTHKRSMVKVDSGLLTTATVELRDGRKQYLLAYGSRWMVMPKGLGKRLAE